MTLSPLQALVRIPGADDEAHPVDIFPGATVESLFHALSNDPHFPKQVSPDEFRVMTVLPEGVHLVFEAADDLFSLLPKEGAELELWPANAPVLGSSDADEDEARS